MKRKCDIIFLALFLLVIIIFKKKCPYSGLEWVNSTVLNCQHKFFLNKFTPILRFSTYSPIGDILYINENIFENIQIKGKCDVIFHKNLFIAQLSSPRNLYQ